MYIRLQTLLRSVQNLRPCINDTNLLQPVGTNVPKGDQDKEVALESTRTSSYVAQPRSCVPYDKSIYEKQILPLSMDLGLLIITEVLLQILTILNIKRVSVV